MSTKHVALIVVAIVAIAAAFWYRSLVFSPAASGPKPRIAVVTGGSSPFWQLIGNGAQAAAQDLEVDLQLLMLEEDENTEQQVALLEKIDQDSIDGVAVSPLDAKGQTPLINALAKKALVATVDSDAPDSDRHSYIGASNIAAGHICGELVKEALPEGGKIAVVLANLTKQNMIDRKEGFETSIGRAEGNDFEIVGFFTDEESPSNGNETIRDLLGKHADLNCIVGMNAQHGPRILKVLKETEKLGEIKVVAFDELKETLAGVESGDIYATVTQDPYQYGYQSVKTLAELTRASETQRPLPGASSITSISTRTVRQNDVGQFRTHLNSRLKSPK